MSTLVDRKKFHSRPVNETSGLLTEEENGIILGYLGRNCFSLAMGVAQLLAADPDPKEWTRIDVGVIVFVKNYSRRQYTLQLFDLDRGLIWEQILYEDFFVNRPFEVLLTFEGDECVYGLNFTDIQETKNFKNLLDNKYVTDMRRKERHTEATPLKTSDAPPHLPPTGTTDSGIVAENYNASPGIFAKFSPKPKIGKKGKPKPLTKAEKMKMISPPTDFRHITHVGLNEKENFADCILDPGMIEILRQIGIDPSKMGQQDKQFVADFVKQNTTGNNGNKPGNRKSMAPPPPPPPLPEDLSGDTDGVWMGPQVGPAPPPVPEKKSNGRSDLLAQIREGTKLTPVGERKTVCEDEEAVNQGTVGKGTVSVAEALARALEKRRQQMEQDDSDVENEDEDDDAEWEDD